MTTSLSAHHQTPAARGSLHLHGEIGHVRADLTGTRAPASASLCDKLPALITAQRPRWPPPGRDGPPFEPGESGDPR